jgi:hypothetical protein
MSRKDHAKRVERERRKKEQRKAEEEQKRKADQLSPKRVMGDLRSLFKEDAARAMRMLFDDGMSVEEISQRVDLSVEAVTDLRGKVKTLPPVLRRLLETNPEVLSNPNVLEEGFKGVNRAP